MEPKPIRHHYTECGLSNVWIDCFKVVDDAGEEVLIIRKIGRLHMRLAKKILRSKHPLSGEELRFLRTEIGHTPAQFGKRINRKATTITRWERNQRPLPPTTQTAIRALIARELSFAV